MNFEQIYQKAKLLESQYGPLDYHKIEEFLDNFEKNYPTGKTQKAISNLFYDKLKKTFNFNRCMGFFHGGYSFTTKEISLNAEDYLEYLFYLNTETTKYQHSFSDWKRPYKKEYLETVDIKEEYKKYTKKMFELEKQTIKRQFIDAKRTLVSVLAHEITHEQQHSTGMYNALNLFDRNFQQFVQKSYPGFAKQVLSFFKDKSFEETKQTIANNPKLKEIIEKFMENYIFNFSDKYSKFYAKNYDVDLAETEAFAVSVAVSLLFIMDDYELWNLVHSEEDLIRILVDNAKKAESEEGLGMEHAIHGNHMGALLQEFKNTNPEVYNLFFEHIKDFIIDNT